MWYRFAAYLCALAVVLASAFPAEAQRRKKKDPNEFPPLLEEKKRKKTKEPVTQVLELQKELPQAVAAETEKLSFVVSSLSAKGLLSQQVRDGLKSLQAQAKGAPILMIRAFVAGPGDLRRVQSIVSEELAERRVALPAMSVARIGALALEGAQVLMEGVLQDRKAVNTNGLVFLPPRETVAAKAADDMKMRLADAGIEGAQMRRITCYLDSLQQGDSVRTQMGTSFPGSPVTILQTLRDGVGESAWCEAVAAPQSAVEIRDRAGAGFLPPGKAVLSGSQMAFGREEADIRLSLDRLRKALENAGADPEGVVYARIYSLTRRGGESGTALAGEYFKNAPAIASNVLFEAVPSVDAALMFDAIATGRSR